MTRYHQRLFQLRDMCGFYYLPRSFRAYAFRGLVLRPLTALLAII